MTRVRSAEQKPPEHTRRLNGSTADTRSDVDMLLFPVKLGHRLRFVRRALVAAALFAAGGCGYRPAAERAAGERLAVVAAPFKTPYAMAAQEVLNGAREELARAEALGSGGFPRLVVEVVRVDELPVGIQAPGGQSPLGRGSDVGVTARAWVEAREGSPVSRDTGDMRRVETVAQGTDSVTSSVAASDAVRASARRVGRALALRTLGIPEPSIEPM
jgi:hypothetical protein